MMRAPVPKVKKMDPPYIRGYRGTPESLAYERKRQEEEDRKEMEFLKEVREAQLEDGTNDEQAEEEEIEGAPQKTILADWVQYPADWRAVVESYMEPRIKDMIHVLKTFYVQEKSQLKETPTLVAEFTRCEDNFYELCFSHISDENNQFVWLYQVFDDKPQPYIASRLILRRPNKEDADLVIKRSNGDTFSHRMDEILKHKTCSLKKLNFVYLNNRFYGGSMLFGDEELDDCSCDTCRAYDRRFSRLAQQFQDMVTDDFAVNDEKTWFEKEPEFLPFAHTVFDVGRWCGPNDWPLRPPVKIPTDFLAAPNMVKLAKKMQVLITPLKEVVFWKFINAWIENETREELNCCNWYISTERRPFNFSQLFERFGLEYRPNRRLEIKLENEKLKLFSKISIHENKYLFFAAPFTEFSDKFNEHFEYCPRRRTLVLV